MQGYTKGIPIDTDVNLALNSDLLVPSQKAVKTYVDSKGFISGTDVLIDCGTITAPNENILIDCGII